MRFGIFYEHQNPAALGGRAHRAPAAQGRARAGRARRPARLRLRLGGRAPLPRGVLATPRRPRSSSRPRSQRTKRIRLGHGIVQIPPARQPPGARRRADRHARPVSRRPGRLRHRRVAPRRRSSAASCVDRDDASARCGRTRSTRSPACSSRSRSPAGTASSSRCRRATSCRSRCRSRTRRCGSPAAAARRSSSPPATGSARSRFSFVEPEDAGTWVRGVLRR